MAHEPVTVELASRRFEALDQEASNRVPFVVLHGLFGSSRNWSSVSRKLARWRSVIAYDLRNHGKSPWQAPHTYEEMARDVLAALDHEGLDRVVLMGHSMGGKVAMRLACDAPDRVEALYVLDIAPVTYPRTTSILEPLMALDLSALKSRGDADRALASSIEDRATRLFLLTNLVRAEDGGFRWQIPLDVLYESRQEIFANPLEPGDLYEGPTRFVAGELSNYVTSALVEAARAHFPKADLVTLAGVGHDVHVEGGDSFLEAVGVPPAE